MGMNWNDNLSVGNDQIDRQHHRLVDMINTLEGSIAAGSDRAVLGNVLDGMVMYARKHFADEEVILAKHISPSAMHAHQEQHDRFLRQAFLLQADFHSHRANLDQAVLSFLQEWLTSHVLNSDKKAME